MGIAIGFVSEWVAEDILALPEQGLILFGDCAHSREESNIVIAKGVKVAPKIGEKHIATTEVHHEGFTPAFLAHKISPTVVGEPDSQAVFEGWRDQFCELGILVLGERD